MNNHAGWDKNGHCIVCGSESTSTDCNSIQEKLAAPMTGAQFRTFLRKMETELSEEYYSTHRTYGESDVSFARRRAVVEAKKEMVELFAKMFTEVFELGD